MEIQVKDIAKSYGGLKAVDGITFDINRGEVYGIIGPQRRGQDDPDGNHAGSAQTGWGER